MESPQADAVKGAIDMILSDWEHDLQIASALE